MKRATSSTIPEKCLKNPTVMSNILDNPGGRGVTTKERKNGRGRKEGRGVTTKERKNGSGRKREEGVTTKERKNGRKKGKKATMPSRSSSCSPSSVSSVVNSSSLLFFFPPSSVLPRLPLSIPLPLCLPLSDRNALPARRAARRCTRHPGLRTAKAACGRRRR